MKLFPVSYKFELSSIVVSFSFNLSFTFLPRNLIVAPTSLLIFTATATTCVPQPHHSLLTSLSLLLLKLSKPHHNNTVTICHFLFHQHVTTPFPLQTHSNSTPQTLKPYYDIVLVSIVVAMIII